MVIFIKKNLVEVISCYIYSNGGPSYNKIGCLLSVQYSASRDGLPRGASALYLGNPNMHTTLASFTINDKVCQDSTAMAVLFKSRYLASAWFLPLTQRRVTPCSIYGRHENSSQATGLCARRCKVACHVGQFHSAR